MKKIDDLKTFCALPWIHLSTRPNGLLRVCCTANASSAGPKNDKKWDSKVGILKNKNGQAANLNTTDLLSSWNNDYMKNIRLKMLNNKVPESCTKCFKEEACGKNSKRIWETDHWKKKIDLNKLINETKSDGSVAPQISYIDLRLGSKCNLKCIMCSPHDSSMWVSDHAKLYDKVKNQKLKQHILWDKKGTGDGGSYNWHQNNPNFWHQLYEQIPNIKQLYFAGGEPTIIEEHYKLIERCIELGYAQNIELRYNSNAIELPDRLFKAWKHFKHIRFHISIDAHGKLNDYIRYPSKWSHIEDQLEVLDNTPSNVEVTISTAVQALNILNIPEFIKWKIQKNYKKINPWPHGAGLINMHLVYLPAFLNIKTLPVQFKQEITTKFDNFYLWLKGNHRNDEAFLNHKYGIDFMQGIIKFMNSEDWSNRVPQLAEYISQLDKIRNTNSKLVLPKSLRTLSKIE